MQKNVNKYKKVPIIETIYQKDLVTTTLDLLITGDLFPLHIEKYTHHIGKCKCFPLKYISSYFSHVVLDKHYF